MSNPNELYHHGIKGMRWGVRRFQKKDGTLTNAGKKRYDDDSGSQSAKPKSKHRQNLEAKYRAMGYDEKHAAERAAKRIKTEKIIAATAGLTLAAASAYVIKNRIEEKSDHIIKSGKILQRVATSDDINFDRALYMSSNKSDKMKYVGLYGKQIRNSGAPEGSVKAFGLKATKDLKVASNEKARDTFAQLYTTNPEFKELHDRLRVPVSGKNIRKTGYDDFNRALYRHDKRNGKLNAMFYDALKSQGYDAVADLNDRKFSGYRAKSATIVFGGKGKMEVSAVRKLTDQEINKKYVKGMAMAQAPELAKAGALYVGAPMMASKTVSHIRAEKYRDEHPNTELTDKEIMKMLREQQARGD